MLPVAPEYESLAGEIRQAFRDARKPEITLRMARAADDNEWGREQMETARKEDDHYRNWEEIPIKDIVRYQDVWLWLCPKGFEYYLPAFMVWALTKHPLISNSSFLGAFDSKLISKGYFEGFSKAEKIAVLHFLEALLRTVQDDYHADWWNYPWDKDWSYDQPKEQLWREIGAAYQWFKTESQRR